VRLFLNKELNHELNIDFLNEPTNFLYPSILTNDSLCLKNNKLKETIDTESAANYLVSTFELSEGDGVFFIESILDFFCLKKYVIEESNIDDTHAKLNNSITIQLLSLIIQKWSSSKTIISEWCKKKLSKKISKLANTQKKDVFYRLCICDWIMLSNLGKQWMNLWNDLPSIEWTIRIGFTNNIAFIIKFINENRGEIYIRYLNMIKGESQLPLLRGLIISMNKGVISKNIEILNDQHKLIIQSCLNNNNQSVFNKLKEDSFLLRRFLKVISKPTIKLNEYHLLFLIELYNQPIYCQEQDQIKALVKVCLHANFGIIEILDQLNSAEHKQKWIMNLKPSDIMNDDPDDLIDYVDRNNFYDKMLQTHIKQLFDNINY